MTFPHPTAAGASLDREATRALALESGFSDAGLASLPHPEQARDAERFEAWVDAGHAGTMAYLERRGENGDLTRARVAAPFPWARSAVVCFAGYDGGGPRSTDAADAGAGWIARYAWSSRSDDKGARRPSDYHKVLLKRLKALEARLHAELGGFESRCYVDTGPLVERALATAAGLGWTAKNTCLIHPKLGSFGFLAVLLTSLPVHRQDGERAQPFVADRCGSCRRCLDACPTDALIAPYQMDALPT
jgi:epoxyqueuosine reductase